MDRIGRHINSVKGRRMQKLKELLTEYGQFALIMHLVLWACTFMMVFAAINLGLKDWVIGYAETILGEEYSKAGIVLLAYAMTKLTQPLRILILIPLVPFVKNKWDERHLE